MSYFGIDSGRYGGWSREEVEKELGDAELPQGRESREEDDD